ncbi:synaptonemal complex central element protein 1-like isoform X3 [Mus pahari]|uniref:synaptonemal complex central element protein 1-like isoform X3 n=1 Tax=Mus pahari TaxID=10093 RepID=UPI00111493B7|nr:synaptonemal complex central element protein 1-like isoform X3 [Mus pahari]
MFCACSKQTPVLPRPLFSYNVCSPTCCLSLLFLFRGTCADTPRWQMAAELEPLMAEWLGAEKAEDTRGQATSLNTMEDLLEMVKKLQKEGSLEPQIEDLIHRINELQQGPAKKRSSEELDEAQALREAMHRELDSLNEEKVHLEEVLCRKQDALSILQKHPQERESDSPPIQFSGFRPKKLGLFLSLQLGCSTTGGEAGGSGKSTQGPLGVPCPAAATGPGDQCDGAQKRSAACRKDSASSQAGGGGAVAAGGQRGPGQPRELWAEDRAGGIWGAVPAQPRSSK